LVERFRISVVEDCAQSFLTRFEGMPVGITGQCCATSFYPTKNLGALGDGGAILTNNAALAERARQLRDYGQSGKYRHEQIGFNSRLDELHAAILRRAHLHRVPHWLAARRRAAEEYIRRIDNPLLDIPGSPSGSESCWHLFPIVVPDGRKKDFMTHMRENGVTVAEHYPTAIVDQVALSEVRHEVRDGCAQARRWCSSQVSLPIHPYLTPDEVNAVVEACNCWS
jgi:dTDP-4-amino-4,6-dideoxygalactose transaminase